MPKFRSEDAKKAWVKQVQATRAKTMAARKTQNEEVIVLDADGEPNEPVKQNGHAIVPDWQAQSLLRLQAKRDVLQAQLAELDTAVNAIKGLT